MKGEPLAIGAAFLVALAVYSFLQTLMEGLVAPALSALFDEESIYLLSFTINGSDFSYGSVLVGLILLALILVLVAMIGKARRDDESRSPRA